MADLTKLQAIVARLRDPETGCPWDVKQDFATIAPYTIEEAYEVADAIERQDMNDLRDELGDLLFQVVFHAQMANEIKAFTLDDVITGICDKMERRHPHVFGTDAQIAAGVQAGDWERHKERERADKSKENNRKSGLLDGIANTLPRLKRAQKLQARAARVGFDWPDLGPIFDKLDEEVAELKEAMNTPDNTEHIADELGDILFVCTNLARKLNIDAESALERSNIKFKRRFAYIEKCLAERNISLDDADLDLMERYWVEAKAYD
ncbi:MAG: nucleoside triphosphate pyrophosphohydrolase [Robiginitomaculum sp.]|nr:nucleoside triphosphate pyrophosphohydrolase [Robiginitomaculum sp.]MDQ7078221.1 nucleoside triphosphate pyrophosphohydrolase [Robiginitomaculum sp.]